MTDVNHIQVALWQLSLLVLIPLSAAALMVVGLRRAVQKRSGAEEERDWSIPPLADGRGTSLLHRWDARCKIITILVYSFVITSLIHLVSALAAISISVGILVIARVSFAKALLRLLA
jgi:cobalt/nickel transport system permease protein